MALLNPSPDAGAQDIDTRLQCPTNVRAIPESGAVWLLWDCGDVNVVGYEYRMKSAGAGWGSWTAAGGRERRFHVVGNLAGNVGYTFQVRAKGTKRVDTTNTYEARRQFITTMSPGPESSNNNLANDIAAMAFMTGSNPDGYLMSGARLMFYDFRDDADPSNDTINDARNTVVKLRANDDRGTTEDPEDPSLPRSNTDDLPGGELYTLTRVGSGPLMDLQDFNLTPSRKLNPNTIYWITVGEGIPCQDPRISVNADCSRAFLNVPLALTRTNPHGWDDHHAIFGTHTSRTFTSNHWFQTGAQFEFSILGYPRRSRDVTTHGAPSAEVSATPSASASVGVTAGQPGGVRATIDAGQVALSWNRVAGVSGYEYSYRRRGGSWSAWTRVGPDVTRVRISLSNPGNYQFRVRTVITTYGAPVSVSLDAAATVASQPPDAVANISVTHNGTSLTARWTASARATHYDVTYYNTASRRHARAAWNRAGTSLTITCDIRPDQPQRCIRSGATYTVGVRARNAGGESEWRNSAPVSRDAPVSLAAPAPLAALASPAAPSSLAAPAPPAVSTSPAAPDPVARLSVTHTGSSLSVSWDAAARAATYHVTYSDDGGLSWRRAASAHSGTTLTIGGVAGAKTYVVGVRARNAVGASRWVDAPDCAASVAACTTRIGTAGADVLHGGSGDADLTGGAGADRFAFSLDAPGDKIITDFSASEGDKIVLRAAPAGSSWPSVADILASVVAQGSHYSVYTLSAGLTVETDVLLGAADFVTEE